MELQIFKNAQFGAIRALKTDDGEPLFVAVDVAKILGYENPSKAIITHCKSSDITKRYFAHSNGAGGTNVQLIKEGNVFRLVMKSKLPSAEAIQDWVCDEVLPSIRKHGGYIHTQENDTPELIMARALKVADQTLQTFKMKNKQLEMENKIQEERLRYTEPLAKLAEDCYVSTETMTASIISSRLGYKSPQQFNNALKSFGIQYKISGDECWKLTSKYSGRGFTKTIPYPYRKNDGSTGTRNSMEWTEAGFVFLREFLNKKVSA